MATKDTTRVYDPFPIPDHQGLQPTGTIAWERIAQTMVRQVLKRGRYERVIVSADPYFGGNDPDGGSADDFARTVRDQHERRGRVIKSLGLKLE